MAAQFPAAARGTEADGNEAGGDKPLDWEGMLPRSEMKPSSSLFPIEISFASSRPSRAAFPLATFRRLAREVIDGPQAADILQLGSPHGYGPLRRYLLEEARRARDAGEVPIGAVVSLDGVIVGRGFNQPSLMR